MTDWKPKNERYEQKIKKLEDKLMRKNYELRNAKRKLAKARERIAELESNVNHVGSPLVWGACSIIKGGRTMKLVAVAATDAYFDINKRYEVLDVELADYLVVIDHQDNVCAIVKPVQLERPIAFSDEGTISRKEYEEVIDYLIDILEEVNMFFRFDLLHVFISKEHRALIRHHVNVIPYDEKEDE